MSPAPSNIAIGKFKITYVPDIRGFHLTALFCGFYLAQFCLFTCPSTPRLSAVIPGQQNPRQKITRNGRTQTPPTPDIPGQTLHFSWIPRWSACTSLRRSDLGHSHKTPIASLPHPMDQGFLTRVTWNLLGYGEPVDGPEESVKY